VQSTPTFSHLWAPLSALTQPVSSLLGVRVGALRTLSAYRSRLTRTGHVWKAEAEKNQHRIQSRAPKKWWRRLTPVTAALSRLLLRCWIPHLRTIISD
jgi:hypothetical protein